MPRYAITEKAGHIVAGQSNTGVGTVLILSEGQAADALMSGTLHPLDVMVEAASPVANRKTPAERIKAETGKNTAGTGEGGVR